MGPSYGVHDHIVREIVHLVYARGDEPGALDREPNPVVLLKDHDGEAAFGT